MKNKIIYAVSILMTIIILLGVIAKAMPDNMLEPDNPLITEVSELKTDIASQSGAANDVQENKDVQTGEEPQESEQAENNSENADEEEEQPAPEETIPEENREISEEQPPEDEENNEEVKNDGNGESGENDEKNPDKDESGDIPTEGGEETVEGPGTGEVPGEDEHGLVTDLYDRIILFSELEDDTIHFYAYYSDASVDSNIRVNYKHKDSAGNGVWLEKSGAHNYSTKLSLGQNYITISYTDGNGNRNWTRITLTYQADKADANTPVKGQNPPIIKTNLDDWNEDIKIFDFTFTVDAKKYNGERIYKNNIQVWLDGELVPSHTGTGIYEYVLEFGMPVEGNVSNHVVSVLAWDDEGNSRYVRYAIRHVVHDEGIEIGTVTMEIDVTTLGLGIVDVAQISIASGDTAADAIVRMLEDLGYEYSYTGSLEHDFYLAAISRADAFRGAAIEERLKGLIERDGISFLPNSGRDKLGEFDYTRGSGWMYFINGEYCPGKTMSKYALNGGEHISLRFTLAFGKDVGSSFNDGSTSLSSYCAKWVNGSIIEYGHSFKETERVEASKEEDGFILYVCEKCREEKKETLTYEGDEDSESGKEENPENPDPENPNPENPNPENPSPENPNPENPNPENPNPENPSPENPNPENPNPENPNPENPSPENPNPENPSPENPNPENPNPENPSPENPDSENPDPENPENPVTEAA